MRVWAILVLLAALLVGCQVSGDTSKATTVPPTTVANTGGAARVTPTPFPTANLPAVKSPAWARNAVMYQIFVRSFYDANGDGVGDLAGITQKLDYLKDLGVTVIWLTPIFQSPSYHGYDTVDYYKIQPAFGTREDLARLVAEAHKRDIRVLLDYVVAHTSNQHPYFKDAFGNPASQYSEFYRWTNDQHTTYEGFAGLKDMPTLNHKSEAVQKYLIDIAKYWLDLDGDGNYKNGVDGFRADYVLNAPHEFWKRLRQEVKAVNPDALLLAEAWKGNVREIEPYLEDEFDAVFDFPLYSSLQGSPDKVGDGVLPGAVNPGMMAIDLIAPTLFYPPGAISVGFINNHDTNRAMSDFKGDMARAKTAATFLMTAPDTPIVYYGEEIGMQGVKGPEGVWDITRREPMDWYAAEAGPGMPTWWKEASRNNKAADGVSVEEEQGKADSLLEHYRSLIKLRRSSQALQSGRVEPIKVTDNDRVFAFVRRTDTEAVLTVLNFGTEPAKLTLDLSETGLTAAAYAATDGLTGKAVGDLTPPSYAVQLPAAGGQVLVLKAK